MTRGQLIFLGVGIGILLWIILLFTTEGYINTVTQSMITYSLIIYFSNALYSVGKNLAELRDYPEEAQSLIKEVEEARRFYKGKGLEI